MSTTLDQTVGAMLLGVIFAAILYGVSCSQVYFYYTHYKKDKPALKVLVAAVWMSDTAHQVLISQSIYAYLVTNYANPTALFAPNNAIITQVIINGVTAFLVQSFFVVRIWTLSNKSLYLVIPVVALVLVEFVASLVYAGKAYAFTSFTEIVQIRTLSILVNVFGAVADVAIAAILCTILRMSRGNFSRTNTLITKLMVFAVNTCLLTSVCACLSLITFFTSPNGLVYIFFYYLLGRLYSNSLMAALNARKSLRNGSSNTGDLSVSLQNVSPAPGTHAYGRGRSASGGITIRIDTNKHSTQDKPDSGDVLSDMQPYDSSQKHSAEDSV